MIGHKIQDWPDLLADAAQRLECFPKLLTATVVFKTHLYGDVGWDSKDESRLLQRWTDCELRKIKVVKEVEFSVRVQRGRDAENSTYRYVRTERCGGEDSGFEECRDRWHKTLEWRDDPFA